MDRKVRGDALEDVALGPGWNADHREGVAAVEGQARFGERVGAHRHADGAAGIEGLHDVAAELAQVVVNDGDRDLAQNLVQVWLWVEDAVDYRRQEQQGEGAASREDAPPLRREGSAYSRSDGGCRDRLRRGRSAAH